MLPDLKIPWLPPVLRKPAVLFFVLVTFLSFFTYFYKYWDPPHVFWDENYHIASAQKYLHGVFFMEQHPPLGKLLIAFGEKILQPNARTDQFLGTDYGTQFEGVSFVGYRFFPALLAWLTAPLLYLLFLRITRKPIPSALLSFLYIFDNALIVHSRGAMLEGTLMFFSVLFLLLIFILFDEKTHSRNFLRLSAALGAAFALIVTTKVLGLIFILFLPVLCVQKLETFKDKLRFVLTGAAALAAILAYRFVFSLQANLRILHDLQRLLSDPFVKFILIALLVGLVIRSLLQLKTWNPLPFFGAVLLPFLLVYAGIWHIHFALGSTINTSLPDKGLYHTSDQYKVILANKTNTSLRSFPVMLRDSIDYVGYYNQGAPRLDLCKKDENGSPFYFWPLGARTINYRWETPNGAEYRYLYLIPNAVIWWGAFAAVLLAAALLIISVLSPMVHPLKHRYLLTVFLGSYVSYMIAISQISRVLYLYHYFIPLLFSFIIFALVAEELRTLGKFVITESRRVTGLLIYGVLIFAVFLYFAPFSYYLPLTDNQVKHRMWLSLWEIACVKCEKFNALAVPTK